MTASAGAKVVNGSDSAGERPRSATRAFDCLELVPGAVWSLASIRHSMGLTVSSFRRLEHVEVDHGGGNV